MGENNTRPVLTISLLVSNRPETVRKCLESLTPLREAIPCELIITDTSKSQEIHDIIVEYADWIYEFEWCNDFAKARNLGLSKARGEWFMYVDDDEWFADLTDMIHFFKSGEYKEYGFANYKTRDFIDPGLNYYSDSWASRMIRIDPDTHFKSKIHEHFEPVRGKLKSLNSITHHVGYIYKTHEDLLRHFQRNEPLLREMMEEEPDNMRWQMQLVQEYRNIKDWDKVCSFCQERLEANQGVDNKYDNIHMGTLYAGWAEALVFQQKYEECIEICHKGLADKRNTEVAKAYLHMKLVEAYFWSEDYNNAKKYLDIYFKEAEELPQNESLIVEQNVALLVNEVFDETNIKKAYSILIGCDLKAGSTTLLEKYYEKLEWKRKVVYVYDHIEEVFVEAMARLPYKPIFSEIVTDAYKNEEFKRLMTEAAQKWEREDMQGFSNLVLVYAAAESEEAYIWSMRVWDAHFKKDLDAMHIALEKYFKSTENVIAIPKNLGIIASEDGKDITEYWQLVSAEQWKKDLAEYLLAVNIVQVENVLEKIDKIFPPTHWKYQFARVCLAERDIVLGPKSAWAMADYRVALQVYVEKMFAFYGEYYQEAAFVHYPETLPDAMQAAMKIMTYLEREAGEGAQALSYLREAANIYSVLTPGIRSFMGQYAEFEKQRENERKKELLQLREQVLAQAKEFLSKGQNQAALTVVQQLKQLFPEDLEVLALGLEVRMKTL